MAANHQTSDRALIQNLRSRAGGRGKAASLLATVVGLVTSLLPGAAFAHHFEEPGNKGAQITVTPDGSEPVGPGVSPGLLPTQPVTVEGKSYPANTRIDLRQCTPSACTILGAAQADATGAFSAQIVVSAYPGAADPAGRTAACASEGPNQCRIVAVQLFGSYTGEPSEAEHNICFLPVTGVGNGCSTSKSVSTTTTVPAKEWEPTAPMSVARRALATAVGADGRVYALGGTGVDGATGSVETFDTCTQTWSPLPPMPTPRTNFAAAAGPDGRIYAIGGYDASGTPLATVDAYDPVTNAWSPVARLAVPRGDLAAATGSDGRVYAIGGKVADGLQAYLPGVTVSAVEAFDPASGTWAQSAPLSAPRWRHNATTGPDGRIYVIGGSSDTGSLAAPPADVETYSPGPDGTPGTWQPAISTGPRPALPAWPAVSAGPDGRIYVSGGQRLGATLRIVWAYDPAQNTWASLVEGLSTRRFLHGAATGRDGRIYAMGGVEDPFGEDGEPLLSAVESLQVGPNTCPRLTQPADFDGDFDTDVSVFRPDSGTWFAKDGDTVAYGAPGDIPIPADYDGDRVTDVAIFRPSVGLWAIHRSSDDTDTFVTYGIGTDVPVPADYDGDGQADIAIFRPEFALWWYRSSSTGLDLPTTFGIGTDTPVPADYDGDAKADIAVFRGGTWFTLPSSGGSYLATAYGAPGDVPVPADYDADRVMDRAIFRPTDGSWSLHRSSDNIDENFTFGLSGDVPVPGDYNGDRISDPAVFRPSSGQWFIETGEEHSWGISTDVPLPLPHAIRRAYPGGSS